MVLFAQIREFFIIMVVVILFKFNDAKKPARDSGVAI